MKIGIMTWYSYNNYGSKLQATAIYNILKQKGYTPTFINYSPRGTISENLSFRVILKKVFDKISNRNKAITNNESFKLYSKNYFSETEKCDSYIDLFQLNDDFDAFVCGSDQIWSPNNFDPRFFLDFANSNKIVAYAPSIGLSAINDSIIFNKMKELINRFNYISIREETGAKIIKDICGKNVNVVVDPTLLMNKDDWQRFESKSLNKELKNDNYIVTYFLGESDKYLDGIKKYAKENKLVIYNIPVYKKRKINKFDFHYEVGPSEFLSLIKNAKCVFTDSFHGTIFSINYNVNFYTYKRFNDKSKINQNSRVTDFLGKLSLYDRIVDNKSLLKNSNIKYSIINQKIEKFRNESMSFLLSSLENINNNKNTNNHVYDKNITNYCAGCGACASICPKKAIKINMNDEGFKSYNIDEKNCIKCGLCKKVCPMNCLDCLKIDDNMRLYSFKTLNHNVLSKSSSGGFGYTVSSYLQKKGYYVCGCVYNNKKDIAEHIIITPNDIDGLKKLQGSKYLQSDCSNAIKECINIGFDNKVLFIGTPCQVAGVDKLTKLKGIRDNFVLVDLICHGVPSNYLWKKYLKELFDKYPKLNVSHNITIRDGKLSSKNKYMNIVIEDHKNNIIYKKNQNHDDFYLFFNNGICFNESCFECPYRTKSSADIRMGDYWGNRFKNERDGISMIIAMTEVGNNLIEDFKNKKEAVITNQNINDYYLSQYPINRNIPLDRKALICDLKKDGISLKTIRKKYFKYQAYKRLIFKIKKILRK